MSMFAAVANIASAAIAPALPLLEYQILPPRPFSELTHLIAVNVLMIGLSNIFWVPLANIFGRRVVLIIAMLLLTLTSMWCGLAPTFNNLLAARVVQGIGIGPADTIAPDIVGEIFFVHQRGRAMAFYTLFLGGGSFIGGIVGAYIAADLGYRYIFWISTALSAFVLLCEIFLVPETLFDRQSHLMQEDQQHGSFSDEKASVETVERSIPTHSYKSTFTFADSLKLGVYRGHVLQKFLGPWRALLFPGTWMVMLHYGGLLGGIVTMSTVAPMFLAAPPYLWGSSVGLINFGAFIGNALGGIVTYVVVDRLTKRAARKDSHGLAEPEARLPGMFPALFLATTGIWMFGFCAAHPSPKAWAGLAVGFGMTAFGIVQIPSVGFNYVSGYSIVCAGLVLTFL